MLKQLEKAWNGIDELASPSLPTPQDIFVNDFGRWGFARQVESSCECFNVLSGGIAVLWTPTLSGPGFNKVPKVLRENAIRGLPEVFLQASQHRNTVNRNNGDGAITRLNLVGQCWSMCQPSLSLAPLKFRNPVQKHSQNPSQLSWT